MTIGDTIRTSEAEHLWPTNDANALTTTGTSVSWQMDSIYPAILTLSANMKLEDPTVLVPGRYSITVKQNSTGFFKLSYGSCFMWEDEEPEISVKPRSITVLDLICDGVDIYCKQFLTKE